MQKFSENDILQFMNLTGCQDEQKAQQYIMMGENNLENAVQLYLDLEGYPNLSQQSSFQSQQTPQNQNKQHLQEVKDVNTMIFNNNNPPPDLIRQRSAPETSLIERYIKYQENKRANDDGILKKTFKYGWNAITYIFKRDPNYGIEFQRYLQQQQIQTTIHFQMGNFNDNLRAAHNETKPLLVYLHNQQSLYTFEKMINCKSFVQIITKNYQIVGFLESPQVQELLPVKPQPPVIQIYRLDLTEQAVLMDSINLTPESNFEELATKMKALKGQFNKLYIMEEQAKRVVDVQQQQYVSNYYGQQYQRQQQQQADRRQYDIQQREREQLIQQQQEAYRIAEQQASEKKRKEQELKQQEENKLLEQQQLNEKRLLQKATLLSNLPEEPEGEDGIEILFRFIHSTKTRRFNFNDKIQSIFDFALSQEDECFNDPNSNIDLIQNFPRLSLKDKKDEIIKDVFTDSIKVQLIVEECE